MTERKTISKKMRFEIFKRDSFKCQYCGKSAPEVMWKYRMNYFIDRKIEEEQTWRPGA